MYATFKDILYSQIERYIDILRAPNLSACPYVCKNYSYGVISCVLAHIISRVRHILTDARNAAVPNLKGILRSQNPFHRREVMVSLVTYLVYFNKIHRLHVLIVTVFGMVLDKVLVR